MAQYSDFAWVLSVHLCSSTEFFMYVLINDNCSFLWVERTILFICMHFKIILTVQNEIFYIFLSFVLYW